jgi:hypothetical protein
MRKNGSAILITLILCVMTLAGSETGKDQEKTGRKTYALVVGGISKESQDKMNMTRAVTGLQKLLKSNPEVSDRTLTILVSDNLSAESAFGTTTAENIRKTIETIGAAAKTDDRFIFYYIGQANIVAEKLRFNLPGADMTHEQLAQWIKEIKTSSKLIVLDCPGSGLAAKAMSGHGRVVICSCTDEQRYRTRFSEYFLPALADNESDTNSDGKISILEAFTAASRQIDDWFRQNKLLTTEIPVLEDNGDGRPGKEPWRYKLDGADGLAASEFFLIRDKNVN